MDLLDPRVILDLGYLAQLVLRVCKVLRAKLAQPEIQVQLVCKGMLVRGLLVLKVQRGLRGILDILVHRVTRD